VASADDGDELLSKTIESDAVPVGAPSVAAQRSSRPVRKSVSAEVAKKGEATARRRAAHDDVDPRTTPIQFARQSVDELRKVVWPTWPQVKQYFWAVLVFVLIVMAYVGLLDLGFGWIMLKLFG